MAAAEVHEITYESLEDLADSILLGYFMPGIGDFILVRCDGWYEGVQDPTYLDIYTDFDSALNDVVHEYKNLYGGIASDYELWHVVD